MNSSAGGSYLRYTIAVGAGDDFEVFAQIRLRWLRIDLLRPNWCGRSGLGLDDAILCFATFVRFVSCLILFSQLQSDHHHYPRQSPQLLLIIHRHCIDYHYQRHPDGNVTIAVFYFHQTRLNQQKQFKDAGCPRIRH